MTISADKLSDLINQELSAYSEEVTNAVKKAVDETSAELLRNTKRDSPRRTGAYRKSITVTTTKENAFMKQKTWHIKGDLYRLAHLLDGGHNITRNGVIIGKARAFPHIKKNEEKAIRNLEKKVIEAINNAK